MQRMLITVAARSKAWVCGRSLAGSVGSRPAGGMDVSLFCCVLSGRGLCIWLITRSEESNPVVCLSDRETLTIRRPWLTGAVAEWGKKRKKLKNGSL